MIRPSPHTAFPLMSSLWMIVASLLFACMGVCVKLGSELFSFGELVFWRGAFGMLLLGLYARRAGVALSTPYWRLQGIRSLTGGIALLCYFYALGQLPLATAVTLSYTSPIFLAILLTVWFHERLHWSAMAAIGVGFVGIVLLLRPTLQADQWPGAMLGLTGGLIASMAYAGVRELGRAGEPELRTVFWFSASTTLIGLPWLATGSGFGHLDLRSASILAGIGIFGMIAQLTMTRAYRYGHTIVSASLTYTTVIFASLFGMLLWDERLTPAGWTATALIIASGVLTGLATRPRRAASNTRP